MYTRHPDFAEHELVTSRCTVAAGLAAIIAVHNSNLGPAIGGCRMLPYASEDAAIADVLRLSRGMSYKAAIAGIPYGGGKSVIIGDPSTQKTRTLLHAMGEFVESLGGRYITSFDSGTTPDDVRTIGERTRFTAGTLETAGNASQSTANGVLHCLKVAVRLRLGRSDLNGVHVAIQGLGNVGRRLAKLLRESGATLTVSDKLAPRATEVAETLNAQIVDSDRVHLVDADVFSPCALGGILSARTIGMLKAKVVVGGANDQLATREDDRRLLAAGILYCPDYLANAGGIIDLHYQRTSWSRADVDRHVESLAGTLLEVIEESRATGIAPGEVADRLAERRIFGSGLNSELG